MSYKSLGLDWLVGKTILAVEGEYRFVTAVGTLVVGCEGDCCSSSWFEQDTGFEAIVGEVILSVAEVPMSQAGFEPTQEDHDKADVLETYSFVIKTAKGYAEIEMRNDSNGYYGGYLTFRLEAP